VPFDYVEPRMPDGFQGNDEASKFGGRGYDLLAH
jgi:hypothetical protein